MTSSAPRFSSLIATVLLVLLQGCLKTDQERSLANGAVVVDAAAARAALVGNTLAGQVTANGMQVPYAMYLEPTGKLTGSAAGDNDRGSWRIQDDGKVCVHWSRWLDAKESCSTYYQEGAEYKAFVPQGGLASVAKVEPGNPRNLPVKTDLDLALEQHAAPLTAAEAKTELTGNTMTGSFKPLRDAPISTFYGDAGKVAAKIGGMANDTDKGEFRIDDQGQVCTRWSKWNDKKESCGKLYRLADKLQFYTPTGSLAVVGTVVKGNSEKLEL